MNLLAFDTSTLTLGVALHLGGEVLSREETGGAQASDRLLPLVAEILAQADVALTDLDAIAFGQGPGAFTGLRTACAAAQGLALGAGLPVIPIVTLAAAAEQARLDSGANNVIVRLDARMGEWYWAHYRHADTGGWQTVTAPCLTSPEMLDAYIRQAAGCEILDVHGPQLAGMLSLADVACRTGRMMPPEDALPLYIRNKVALTTAEREAARAARETSRPDDREP